MSTSKQEIRKDDSLFAADVAADVAIDTYIDRTVTDDAAVAADDASDVAAIAAHVETVAATDADTAGSQADVGEVTVPFQSLTLLPTQVAHAERLRAILRIRPIALDFSMLGAGKTYTASDIVLDPTLSFRHAIVVSPLSVKPKWLDMGRIFGVPILTVISFCALRSTKCRQPKHALLQRRDHTVRVMIDNRPRDIDKVEFLPTPLYRRLVAEGLLLIVDEVQNVKNVSAQFGACRAMVGAIVGAFREPASSCPSRVLLLSGSPIDRHEQAVTLMRTMHIMSGDELTAFNIGLRRMEWRGMQEIENHCRTIDAEATRLLRGPSVHPPDAYLYAYTLFQNVLKHEYASSMPVPVMDARIVKHNSYYNILSRQDRSLLSHGVDALARACRYNGANGTVNFMPRTGGGGGVASLRAITRAMQQIETAKIATFVRVANTELALSPNRKLVICVGYNATIRDMAAALKEYRPLILNGSTRVGDRARILQRFQRPDTEFRVLIGNLTVCSTGIDLDDKDGRFPRCALVSPSYNTITLYQFGHRFQRADTKSDSDVRFIYGKHVAELNVLGALSRKSNVMKQTTQEQADAGVVFPGDHDEFVEEGDCTVTSDDGDDDSDASSSSSWSSY